MRQNFLNNNQWKLRKLRIRIPVSIRPTKVINPKKEYNKHGNREIIERELDLYEFEKEEEKLRKLYANPGD